MVQLGLVESRTLAQRMVMAGQVRVNGQVVLKPAEKFTGQVDISLEESPRFVSRGGEKLAAALEAFGLTELAGKICVDVGASTGGFTDCLLQSHAARVYAIDVGYGILHWKIRNDPRVVVMERTNARYVKHLPENIDLVVVDASFISLKILLPVISTWFPGGEGQVVALIKPQFEAGREDTARGEGVIRDTGIHRKVLEDVLGFAVSHHWAIGGLIRSPLVGPKGNIEFLVHLKRSNNDHPDLSHLVDEVLVEKNNLNPVENGEQK